MKPNILLIYVNALSLIDQNSSTYRNIEFVTKTNKPMDAVLLLDSLVTLSSCHVVSLYK